MYKPIQLTVDRDWKMTTAPSFTKFILPISGTDFVRYMAFFSILSEYNIKPSQIYCASGGCLAAYMAMMSSFTKQIEDWNVSSDMIIEKTTPFKFRTVTYIMNGYLYRRPDMESYVRRIFVPAKMRDVEIISGYYKTTEKEVVISTNFIDGQSSIGAAQKDRLKEWNVNLSYGPTDMDELMTHTCNCIQRTSNIPYLLESDDKSSVDFGVIAPSPRLLLNVDPHQSIYFCPIDLTIDKGSNLINSIFYRMIVNDIITIENRFSGKASFDSLAAALQFAGSKSRYTLIIFTKSDIMIPITSFGKKEVQAGIAHTKAAMQYIVYHGAPTSCP